MHLALITIAYGSGRGADALVMRIRALMQPAAGGTISSSLTLGGAGCIMSGHDAASVAPSTAAVDAR